MRRHGHQCKESASEEGKRHLIAKHKAIIGSQSLQLFGGFRIGQPLGPVIRGVSVGGLNRHLGTERGQDANSGGGISPSGEVQSAPFVRIDDINVTEAAVLCGIALVDARAKKLHNLGGIVESGGVKSTGFGGAIRPNVEAVNVHPDVADEVFHNLKVIIGRTGINKCRGGLRPFLLGQTIEGFLALRANVLGDGIGSST
mmetsp:Transcript_17607/g.50408  ORF Transcript_17607/g.50408 Transcript_17607/m.50408 type:complete len:200 (+) Transcript_17607:92-691(+)